MCVGPQHFIWSLRFPISVFFYAVVFTLIWVFCFVFFFCCCGFFNIYLFFLFLTYVLFLPFRRLNSNFFRTLPVGAFTGLPSLGVLWVYLLRSCYLKHFITVDLSSGGPRLESLSLSVDGLVVDGSEFSSSKQLCFFFHKSLCV